MSPTQKKRFTIVAIILGGVSLAAFFAVRAFNANIEYFLTPTQVNAGEFVTQQRYRVAGLVRKGSKQTLPDGVTHQFKVTDCVHDIAIRYTGLLPDLFREGQAIVAIGSFDGERLLTATQVLAKHDENYVPNEAAEAVMLAQANKCDDNQGPVAF